MDEASLNQSLNLSRRELLDMGLRGNSLLNFVPRAKSLSIVEELSKEIFRILIEDQKSMSFLAIPEEMVTEEEEQQLDIVSLPLPVLLAEKYGEERFTDNKLQTKLSAEKLDRQLLKIYTEANTYFQEQGIDILYLALGFLHWYEDANSDLVRKAPLVLIPVELVRSVASEAFKLRYTQAELGTNLTLAEKLKSDFYIDLPELDEEFEVIDYFNQVRTAIEKQSRWKVADDEIALGFFSFGKFLMYQDLDPERWPEDKKPHSHSVLSSLLGHGFDHFGEFGDPSLPDNSAEVSTPDLTTLHLVLDADSTQTEAVLAAKSGNNLVIQGPPGTGKSQTITNIIAESLADNKTILFVSEKMAALDVVKKRLDECEMGDAVLELHSHKSNKKSVMAELKRTLELGQPEIENPTPIYRKHKVLREQLDAYAEQVNTPILNSGLSYIRALGLYLKEQTVMDDGDLPTLDFAPIKNWDFDAFTEACAQVSLLADHIDVMGIPAKSCFAKSTLEQFSPVDQHKATELLGKAIKHLEETLKKSAQLAESFDLRPPETTNEIITLCQAGTVTINRPGLTGIKLVAEAWQQNKTSIQTMVECGTKMATHKKEWDELLISQAWKENLIFTRQVLATKGRKWWRFLSPEYHRAKSTLQGLMKGEFPKDRDVWLSMLGAILDYQTQLETFNPLEKFGASLYGSRWLGEQSHWSEINAITNWTLHFYDAFDKSEVAVGILQFLEDGGEHSLEKNQLAALNELVSETMDLFKEVLTTLAIEFSKEDHEKIASLTLKEEHQLLVNWAHNIDALQKMAQYNRLCKKFKNMGLSELSALSYQWNHQPQHLLSVLKSSWFMGLIEEAYKVNEALMHFDRLAHEKAIEEFNLLDKQLFHHAKLDLINKHHQNLPATFSYGEVAVIQREMNKKRRIMPIRRLIREAGRALQSIKPVFMMSPMSVATYLEQGTLSFDLVVFDEASQVKVVEGLGALLRGEQTVVVGDTKQLPPTDFFSQVLELDDEEAEESQTADIESILSMFLSKGAPEKLLRWHYRSRHDSLITVSNEEFYEGKLMVFPSPGVNPFAKGLCYRLNRDAIYERGGSRTNPTEAREVAEAVIEHAKNTPELTLGVVAFSTAQRDRIILELERLRREDPSTEEFFATDTLENFFVKNLENVQGDERDTIYISIGYGRTASGNVSRGFGPLNREGGERRLNVLITRARLGMEVFCNFTADELKTEASSPFGVRAMKNFLKFAETGVLEQRKESGKETDSPFEDQVITAIQQLGYAVEPQVGCAGFYIDIAVRDPDKAGRYILAVECDGASYHSSASARDRDRLRQDVLEGLGWRFHRVWSTDWFRNPHLETQRLQESICGAIAYHQQSDNMQFFPLHNKKEAEQSTGVIRSQKNGNNGCDNYYTPYNGGLGLPVNKELHEIDLQVIINAVARIVESEGPIHISEAIKRIINTVGVSRAGSRIQKHIKMAVTFGSKKAKFHFSNDFIYLNANKQVSIRDRSTLPSASRKIELIPPEEIDAAIEKIVKGSFSISIDDAISGAVRILGIQRATEHISSTLSKRIARLEKQSRIRKENGNLVSNQN
jgi:very-short-patch-repair endonuclease/DNA polymerase III delta prime subunit